MIVVLIIKFPYGIHTIYFIMYVQINGVFVNVYQKVEMRMWHTTNLIIIIMMIKKNTRRFPL